MNVYHKAVLQAVELWLHDDMGITDKKGYVNSGCINNKYFGKPLERHNYECLLGLLSLAVHNTTKSYFDTDTVPKPLKDFANKTIVKENRQLLEANRGLTLVNKLQISNAQLLEENENLRHQLGLNNG